MHTLSGRAESLYRSLGTLVEDVGAEGDALQVESLKCVRHQQELCIGVVAGSPGDAIEPGRSDLDVGVVPIEVPIRS